jgi:methylphosphotriester-DNA--protein-cysteine methyltransferase
VDLCLAWILDIGQRGSGVRFYPLRVELTRPPDHREALEEHFRCRVKFGAVRNALQRQLTGLRVTFQQLLQEARQELAHHYLTDKSLELTAVAYLLGFAHANSFFRAFQCREGVSPYRRCLRARRRWGRPVSWS